MIHRTVGSRSLNAKSRSWHIAARNAEDGISAAHLAESALLEILPLAQRLRELGSRANNSDILTTTDIVLIRKQQL